MHDRGPSICILRIYCSPAHNTCRLSRTYSTHASAHPRTTHARGERAPSVHLSRCRRLGPGLSESAATLYADHMMYYLNDYRTVAPMLVHLAALALARSVTPAEASFAVLDVMPMEGPAIGGTLITISIRGGFFPPHAFTATFTAAIARESMNTTYDRSPRVDCLFAALDSRAVSTRMSSGASASRTSASNAPLLHGVLRSVRLVPRFASPNVLRRAATSVRTRPSSRSCPSSRHFLCRLPAPTSSAPPGALRWCFRAADFRLISGSSTYS